MDMQEYSYYNSVDHQRRQLAKTESGLLLFFKWAWKALIFFPLLITGYWVATKLLTKQSEGILWVVVPILVAMIIYGVLIGLKSVIISQKQKGNLIWLPVFIICVAFSCILPVYIAFDPVNQLIEKVNGSKIVTYLILFILTIYVYRQYDYLGHFSTGKK